GARTTGMPDGDAPRSATGLADGHRGALSAIPKLSQAYVTPSSAPQRGCSGHPATCAISPRMKTIRDQWNAAPGAVTLIDAHHHLWDLKANRYPFLSHQPEPHFFLGAYDAIRRDYLPADYLRDSRAHNVLTTVHCEAEMDRSRQVAETEWLTDVSARHGFPGAIVAHAWFHTDNAEEILAAQARFPLVRGIRSKPVTALRPNAMTPGAPGTMQDDKWL